MVCVCVCVGGVGGMGQGWTCVAGGKKDRYQMHWLLHLMQVERLSKRGKREDTYLCVTTEGSHMVCSRSIPAMLLVEL